MSSPKRLRFLSFRGVNFLLATLLAGIALVFAPTIASATTVPADQWVTIVPSAGVITITYPVTNQYTTTVNWGTDPVNPLGVHGSVQLNPGQTVTATVAVTVPTAMAWSSNAMIDPVNDVTIDTGNGKFTALPASATPSETIIVTWLMPAGGSSTQITWPQTLVPAGVPACGTGQYQLDKYPYGSAEEKAKTDKIMSDGILTKGEDYGWVIAWSFDTPKNGKCNPTPTPTPTPTPVVTPTPRVTPVVTPTPTPTPVVRPIIPPTPPQAPAVSKPIVTTPVVTAGHNAVPAAKTDWADHQSGSNLPWLLAGFFLVAGVGSSVRTLRSRRAHR